MTNNIAPWPAYASAYDGYTNFALAPTARAYPLYFYTEYENPNLRSAPVISLVSNGDQRAEIYFEVALDGIIDNVGDYRFAVFVNGEFHGFYKANTQANGVANGTFTIGGLINNTESQIRIQTTHARYNENGTIYRAEKSAKSNALQVDPTFSLAARSFPDKRSQYETCDIISSSVGSYFDANFNGLTQYDYNGSLYDPIAFTPNVAISVMYAKIHVRARGLLSSRDTTSQSFVDYNIKNIELELDEPFNVCIGTNGQRGISEAFNAEVALLGKDNPNMQFQQQKVIEYNLRREYVKAKPFITKKFQKMLQQNAGSLMNSLPTYRQLLNILSFSNTSLNYVNKDFTIRYAATIFVNPKIIAAHNVSATRFNYALENQRGRDLKLGKNNLAILINYPQNFSYYSYIPLSSVLTTDEVLGNVPTS
jgi:hypothetical protein